MSRQQAQAIALNVRAEMHESSGNTLLASWMRASAEHFRKLDLRTKKALDEMPLGAYEESNTRKEKYAHDWYAYEDEYAYNFNGLE